MVTRRGLLAALLGGGAVAGVGLRGEASAGDPVLEELRAIRYWLTQPRPQAPPDPAVISGHAIIDRLYALEDECIRRTGDAPESFEISVADRRSIMLWLVAEKRFINHMRLADGRLAIEIDGIPAVYNRRQDGPHYVARVGR